ncbi:hypothetical protein ACFE04_003549 [Oxalis oulophora]
MEGFFSRSKRVSQTLDDQVKARLIGQPRLISYASSGSDHSVAAAAITDEDDSPCLSELVHGFLEDDGDEINTSSNNTDFDADSDLNDNNRTDSVESVLKTTLFNAIANFNSGRILSHVLSAMERSSSSQSDKSIFIRKVMSFLREIGYNAAICKTKWESSGGLTAGNYEYIDVQSKTSRYIIELDFASQFEIARPTRAYTRLAQSLPRVFVGKNEELKTIVKLMCDEAKRSLKSRDLSLPPWRKNRYMQNKWFGPYRRTVNGVTGNVTASNNINGNAVNGENCRYVGFNVGVNASLFVPEKVVAEAVLAETSIKEVTNKVAVVTGKEEESVLEVNDRSVMLNVQVQVQVLVW